MYPCWFRHFASWSRKKLLSVESPLLGGLVVVTLSVSPICRLHSGLRIKETKEVYEGEVTELTPCETENPMGGYGKTISHVIIGLKTGKGTKQLKVRLSSWVTHLLYGSQLSCCCDFDTVLPSGCSICKEMCSGEPGTSSRNALKWWPNVSLSFLLAGPQHLWESSEGASGSGRRHLHRSQQWSRQGNDGGEVGVWGGIKHWRSKQVTSTTVKPSLTYTYTHTHHWL